jgi:hypothetical protein
VPRSILYDNLKLAVARILGDGRRLRTRVFSELQSHYQSSKRQRIRLLRATQTLSGALSRASVAARIARGSRPRTRSMRSASVSQQ